MPFQRLRYHYSKFKMRLDQSTQIDSIITLVKGSRRLRTIDTRCGAESGHSTQPLRKTFIAACTNSATISFRHKNTVLSRSLDSTRGNRSSPWKLELSSSPPGPSMQNTPISLFSAVLFPVRYVRLELYSPTIEADA